MNSLGPKPVCGCRRTRGALSVVFVSESQFLASKMQIADCVPMTELSRVRWADLFVYPEGVMERKCVCVCVLKD